MKLTGPEIISTLREQLTFTIGRHLYVVLGSYAQLRTFEQVDLTAAVTRDGTPLPAPINLNRRLLDTIDDATLRRLMSDEARLPKSVRAQLDLALRQLLDSLFRTDSLVILKQVEILFAYGLDLSAFRTAATNQNHLVLLLPGAWVSDRVHLFHEADARFHRTLPENLVAENHIWELTNG